MTRVASMGVSSLSLTAISTLPAASEASRAQFIQGKLNETVCTSVQRCIVNDMEKQWLEPKFQFMSV
ncbi:hypothetical protein pfor_3c0284 [Rhodobacteraceae bacterium SB2]|nr:hypothetical protein pfor_3c0284 [Rhodobacteraceae bacterium SB2]